MQQILQPDQSQDDAGVRGPGPHTIYLLTTKNQQSVLTTKDNGGLNDHLFSGNMKKILKNGELIH